MRILKNVDENFWWEVAKKCDYATFFHTPLWQQLAMQTYPDYASRTLCIELENGTRAVFPALEIERKGMIFSNIISTFAGCYGGLIADGPIAEADQVNIFERFCRWNIGELMVTESPSSPAWVYPVGNRTENHFTQILTLNPHFDTLFSNFSNSRQRAIIKGRRMGVSTRLASNMQDFRDYYGAYEDSLRRWGQNATSCYPRLLFDNLYHMFSQYPEQVRLWLAEVDGKVVAGVVTFQWHQYMVYWHGAAYEQYFTYNPTKVLFASIIEDACSRGFEYFDFNPSGDHEGVSTFKARFGAEKRNIRRIFLTSSGFMMARKLRQKLRMQENLGQSAIE